jgi:type II secretory pathway component PulC
VAIAAQTSAPKKADLPPSAIRRSSVRDLLAQGPGAFLQRIAVDDEAVFVGGKFHGFRITALRGDMWQGVDLKPGDVITGVNGFPVEHPEEALEAFKSLAVSSELKVMYERDGVPRELRYAIVED